MPKDYANPQIIGRSMGARRSSRHIIADDGSQLRDAANSLMQASQSMKGAVDFAAGIYQERQEADYQRALNAALKEADARLQSEVWSSTGFGAEGAPDRVAAIMKEVGAKHMKGLSSRRTTQKFEQVWGRQEVAQNRQALVFESGQLRNARYEASSSNVKQFSVAYAGTGDTARISDAIESFNEGYAIKHGGIINAESLKTFDEDVNDGDGFVALPDGRKLKIVDTVEDSTDQISKDSVAKIRETLVARSNAYTSARAALVDALHAQRIDHLMKNGDIDGAYAYLQGAGKRGGEYQMSAGAFKSLDDFVGRRKQVADDNDTVAREVAAIATRFSEYGGPGFDSEMLSLREELGNKYARDPERKARVLGAFADQYRLISDRHKVNLNGATVEWLSKNKGLTPAQMSNALTEVKDPQLRSTLSPIVERMSRVYDSDNSPSFRMQQERLMTAVKLALYHRGGSITVDTVTYNLTEDKDLETFLASSGLTSDNQKKVLGWVRLGGERLDPFIAIETVSKALNLPSLYETMTRYPAILTMLEKRKGTAPIEREKQGEWVRRQLFDILNYEVTEYDGWNSKVSMYQAITGGYEDWSITPAQARDIYLRNHPGPRDATDATDATDDKVRSYMGERGFGVDDDGNYYPYREDIRPKQTLDFIQRITRPTGK